MYKLILNKILPLRRKENILLACFPKSGSSFTSRNLAAILGYEFTHIAGSLNNRPNKDILLRNEPYLTHEKLKNKCKVNFVSQGHFIATTQSISLINRFNIRVIVQVRNIFDICVSMRDHILNDINKTHFAAFINEDFSLWPMDKQLDFVIDMIIPWYIKFYVSWYEQAPFFVTYEEMVSNNTAFFIKLLRHCGHEVSANEIEEIVRVDAQPEGRFNKGVTGRGEGLDETQKNRIRRLFSYYPEVDFSRII